MSLLPPILFLISAAAANGPTYYINQQPLASSYSALQTCAMEQVSTMVRDMQYGCGVSPSNSYTSFGCFCTSSKSKLQWTMQSVIMDACSTTIGGEVTASQQITSALGLYNSYCQLPLMAAATASATAAASTLATSASNSIATATASPGGSVGAAGAANTSPAQTTTTTPSSHPSNLNTGAIIGIAVGLSMFLVLVLVLIAAFFFMRRKKPATEPNEKRDSDEHFFVPMYLDQASKSPGERSTSYATMGSSRRDDSHSGSSPVERPGLNTSQHRQHRRMTNEEASPAELVSPSTPAGALTRSGSAWASRAAAAAAAQLPSRPEERRLTPMAELPQEGAERAELEGNLPAQPRDTKALPPTPDEPGAEIRHWI